MGHLVEAYEHAGQKVEIFYDEDPADPRDYDGHAQMVTWHRHSKLGDEQLDLDEVRSHQFKSDEEVLEYFRKERKARVIQPLYIYDHSGITIRTAPFGDPWDSGMVGFIYATNAMIREWHMLKRNADITPEILAAVVEGLNAEVEEYDKYLTGDCFGYVVTPSDQRIEEDSCWGFFGMEYVKQQANEAAKYLADVVNLLPPPPYALVLRSAATGKEMVVTEDVKGIDLTALDMPIIKAIEELESAVV